MKFLITNSLNKKERKEIEEKGLFCYELRDTDLGNGIATIEDKVLVNNIGSIITNEELMFENDKNGIDYIEFIINNKQVESIDELLDKDFKKDIDIDIEK